MKHTPLLIAAHGTRDPEGVRACEALVARVRGMLPDTQVEVGYVELTEPPIDEALASILRAQQERGEEVPHATVVPLMLNTGGHVREDIPESVAEAERDVPGAQVTYGRPLGEDPRLLAAVEQRIAAAVATLPGDVDPRDVTVVLLGRGAAVADANADHARMARMLYERGRYAQVLPAYIQVARPGLPEAVGQAAALGASAIVVAPYFLLPGMLRTWCREQLGGWTERNADVPVALAEVIGDCDELAAVVVERYREAAADPVPDAGSPTYMTGLRLDGREVLVVGAGHVADRRVPRLVEAGAVVRLVSPTLSIKLRRYVREGLVSWEQRGFAPGDVGAAWYVLACTNDPAVNEAVAAEAEAAHTFCVRADAARRGSAWTPATESSAGLTVAVLGRRDPRRSVTVRDALLRVLHG